MDAERPLAVVGPEAEVLPEPGGLDEDLRPFTGQEIEVAGAVT